MSWLAGFNHRVKFTVPTSQLTGSLTDFPTLVYISTGSGINDEDVSAVFDNLGASSQKIAITNSDGTTQNYCEVELWNTGSKQAWIWSNLSLSTGSNNDFYLYFDSAASDNTTYVGVTPSDTPTNSVWDTNYMMVHHLQGADAVSLDDSTSNNNDVSGSSGTPDFNYSAKVGNGIYFTANGERVNINDSDTLDGFTEATWEYWFNMHTAPAVSGRRCQFVKYLTTGNQRSWSINLYNDASTTKFKCYLSKDGINALENSYTWAPTVDTWYNIGIRWDSSTATTPVLYINGAVTAWTVGAAANGALYTGSDALYLGFYNDSSYHDGAFDEVRISNLDRGASYMVTSYNTQIDNLIDWGAFEDLTASTPSIYGDGLIWCKQP